jgi:hypothetical protein
MIIGRGEWWFRYKAIKAGDIIFVVRDIWMEMRLAPDDLP